LKLVLDVRVEGAPPPATCWLHEGTEVSTDDVGKTRRVSHAANVAKLVYARADRGAAGKYVLRAENAHGKDEVAFELRVCGRPSQPMGPIVVSDVSAKSCLLAWQPPEDDGGSVVDRYEVERLDPYVQQWIPSCTSKETTIRVAGLAKGKAYKFRVRAITAEGESTELETEGETLAADAFSPPEAPGRPEATDWGVDFAELRWSTPEDDGGATIERYRVEVRNANGSGRQWNPAGDFEDSDGVITDGIEAGGEHEFRVTAVNKVGESEPSRPSRPVQAKARYSKPAIDDFKPEINVHVSQALKLSAKVLGEPRAKVSWWSPSGAKIEASDKAKLDADDEDGQVSLTLTSLTTKDSGTYKLKANNSEGSTEVTTTVTVVGPPGAPNGPLDIEQGKNGVVRLAWRRSKNDGGASIASYLVERRRVDREEWVSCGSIAGKTATALRDLELEVSGLLEGEVYVFRVSAANQYGEGEPLSSDMPVAGPGKRSPDPPSKPRLKEDGRGCVVLEWTPPRGEEGSLRYIVEQLEHFRVPKMEEEAQQSKEDEQDEQIDSRKSSSSLRPPLGGPSAFSGEFQDYVSKWMTAERTEEGETSVRLTNLGEGHTYRLGWTFS